MGQDTSVTDFSSKTHKLEYPKKDTIRMRCQAQPQPHMPRIMPRLIKSSIYFRPIKMWLTKPLTKMVLTEAFLVVGYSGDKRKLRFLDWKEARSENEGGGGGGGGAGAGRGWGIYLSTETSSLQGQAWQKWSLFCMCMWDRTCFSKCKTRSSQ